ncbi:hypothetical protein [uncultured Deinococcus sp.]|uniref:hypothetical protein n=1 Tax=uncultured Deinococcus sp. TaxID=158789 RepID=UPI0025FD8355|nr:hypothetical protein [uncultured Deinococcus sp.]
MEVLVVYNAPLEANYHSGFLELKRESVDIDSAGRKAPAWQRAIIHPDRRLTDLQTGLPLTTIVQGPDDPTFGPLDWVETLNYTRPDGTPLSDPKRQTKRIPGVATREGFLDLHVPGPPATGGGGGDPGGWSPASIQVTPPLTRSVLGSVVTLGAEDVVTYAGQNVDEIALLPGLTGTVDAAGTLTLGVLLDLAASSGPGTVGGTFDFGTPTVPTTATLSGGAGTKTFTYHTSQPLRITRLEVIGTNGQGAILVPVGSMISVTVGDDEVTGVLAAGPSPYDRTATFTPGVVVPADSTFVVGVASNAVVFHPDAAPGTTSTDGTLTYLGTNTSLSGGSLWLRVTSEATAGGGGITGELPVERLDPDGVTALLAPYARADDLLGLSADLTALIGTVAADLDVRLDTLEARPAFDAEVVQDTVAAMFGTAGTYDDGAGTYTLPPGLTSEQVQDIVAALIQAGQNVTVAYNDAADTYTISAVGGTSGLTAVVHDASLSGDGTPGSPLGVARRVVTLTASVPTGGHATFDAEVGLVPTDLRKLTTDHAADVALYLSAADRAADATRLTNTPNSAASVYVLGQYRTVAGTLSVSGNRRGVNVTPLYVALVNRGAAGPVTLTLTLEDC